MVVTSMHKAIVFLLELEERKRKAFPKRAHPKVVDNHLQSMEIVNKDAERGGYTGEYIHGPSTDWVQPREGDDVGLPQTAISQSARFQAERWLTGERIPDL